MMKQRQVKGDLVPVNSESDSEGTTVIISLWRALHPGGRKGNYQGFRGRPPWWLASEERCIQGAGKETTRVSEADHRDD